MKFRSKKSYTIYIIVIVIIIAIFYFTNKSTNQEITTQNVKIQTLIQEVIITGKVKPVDDINLSFDSTGRVGRINFNVGEKVIKGSIIASLENGSLFANVSQAKANLEVKKADLASTLKGTRKEEIDITKADLEKAKQDLLNHFSDIPDIANDTLVDADDALNKQTFQMFTNPNGERPELIFDVTNFQNKVDAESNRTIANNALNELQITASSLPLSDIGKKESLKKIKIELEIINTYLNSLFNALTYGSGISESTKDTYKANVTTARTNITATLSSVNRKLQSIASQEATVKKTENQLNLQFAGATKEDIDKANAIVDEANAQLTGAKANLTKTLIISPISGIISRIDIKKGETVTSGVQVVGVISENNFEIEVNVPEVDISKLSIGDTAFLTLDAYGPSIKFYAEVSEIEPAERVIEGVSTYKTTLVFAKKDERIKSGMTANLNIETEKKENVLVIPQRAVITKENKQYVRIPSADGQIKEREITTGLRGAGGLVEVVSGLNETDEVVTFIKEN